MRATLCLLVLLLLGRADAAATLQDVTSVAVSAVGGLYVRYSARQELRPLMATFPYGPVCSTSGVYANAPSIATEFLTYSMISDVPQDATYVPSLQCFGQAVSYITTNSLWRDVLLCGSYYVEPNCSTPLLSALFTSPALHSFATARDFIQFVLLQAQDLAYFNNNLAELSTQLMRSDNVTSLQVSYEAVYADFSAALNAFTSLIEAVHNLLPLQSTAAHVSDLQTLLQATNNTLLAPAVSAALLAQLNAHASALQLLGATFAATRLDVTEVTSLSSFTAVSMDTISLAAVFVLDARNATSAMNWTQDSSKFAAIQALVSTSLQFSASSLWLLMQTHAASFATSLAHINSPQCGRNGSEPLALCTLFASAVLEAEAERQVESVFTLYNSLMQWVDSLGARDEEPFQCWRAALTQFSNLLLALYQGLPLPLGAPFDVSLCEAVWLQQFGNATPHLNDCNPFTSVLCYNACNTKCIGGEVLDENTCTCACPANTEPCGGLCVPQCPSASFTRDSLCRCDCHSGDVALWQMNALTVSSPTLTNDPLNAFSGNMVGALGLTEVEVYDQEGELIKPIGCTDSGAAVGFGCAGVSDGRRGNTEAEMWLSEPGVGFAWLQLDFNGSVVRVTIVVATNPRCQSVSRILVYNWNNASSPNLGMARVKLYAGTLANPFAAPLFRASHTSLSPLDGSSSLAESNALAWADRDDAPIAGPVECVPCSADFSAPTSRAPRSSVLRDCQCAEGYMRYGTGERCVPALRAPTISPTNFTFQIEAVLALRSEFSSAMITYSVTNSSGGTVIPWTSYLEQTLRVSCEVGVDACQFGIQAQARYRNWVTSPAAAKDVYVVMTLDNLPPTISGAINHTADSVRVSISAGVQDPRVVCRFSADGSDVTSASLQYVAPFLLTGRTTHTIKARNFFSGASVELQSPQAIAAFTPLVPAAAVTFNPPAGTYGPIQVSFNAIPLPTLIFYTLDGTDPTSSNTSIAYTAPIRLSAYTSRPLRVTLYAINAPAGLGSSMVTMSLYTILPRAIAPVLAVQSGNFRNTVTGLVSCPSAGSAPYVEVNGTSDPTLSSAVLLSPFTYHLPVRSQPYLNRNDFLHQADLEDVTVSIAVRCIRNGFLPSDTVTRDYFLTNYSLTNDPVVAPQPDEYLVDELLYVSFACAEPQCSIYWSSSVQRPDSTSGQLYAAPLALRPGSHAISAVAYAPSFDRGSRSLVPFVFLVVGKQLPPPLVSASQPASALAHPSAVTVTLNSSVTDTLLHYVLLEVGAEIDSEQSVDWIMYTQPIIIAASARLAVIQDNRFYKADNTIYNSTYIISPPTRAHSTKRWWPFVLLGVGLLCSLLVIGAGIYLWRRRQREQAKQQLVLEVLPSLGLVIKGPGSVSGSEIGEQV